MRQHFPSLVGFCFCLDWCVNTVWLGNCLECLLVLNDSVSPSGMADPFTRQRTFVIVTSSRTSVCSSILSCIILDYKNSKFKNLSNSIAIDFLFYWNFTSIDNIRSNPTADLSKFTSNKKNIKWICRFSLQSSLLSNFVQDLIIFCLKNFMVFTIFFKGKNKNHNTFKIYIIIINFFSGHDGAMTTRTSM